MAREDGLEPSTSCSRDKRFTDSTTPEYGCLDSIRTNTARAKIWCPTLRRQGNGADTKNRTLRMRKHRRFTVSTVSIAGYISIGGRSGSRTHKAFGSTLFKSVSVTYLIALPFGGRRGTRTLMTFLSHAPKACVATNYTILPSFKMQFT